VSGSAESVAVEAALQSGGLSVPFKQAPFRVVHFGGLLALFVQAERSVHEQNSLVVHAGGMVAPFLQAS